MCSKNMMIVMLVLDLCSRNPILDVTRFASYVGSGSSVDIEPSGSMDDEHI